MNNAFKYIQANKGIDTESSYPYTARAGSCHYSTANIGATISGKSCFMIQWTRCSMSQLQGTRTLLQDQRAPSKQQLLDNPFLLPLMLPRTPSNCTSLEFTMNPLAQAPNWITECWQLDTVRTAPASTGL
jgi:hypothetical protein